MRRFTISTAMVFFSFLALTGCEPEDGAVFDEASNSIVGGHTETGYPAVGAMTRYGSVLCTGTLITPRLVVTAAHCLYPYVRNNTKFRVDNNGTTYYDIEGYAYHDNYDSQRIRNDIGILVLTSDVAGVTPIAANAVAMNDTWIGDSALAVGYGVTSANANDSGVKRSVSIPITHVFSDRFGWVNNNYNTCFGDSGGPALLTVNNVLSVVGITSYGDRSCARFGVDTRVDNFISWLQPFIDTYN